MSEMHPPVESGPSCEGRDGSRQSLHAAARAAAARNERPPLAEGCELRRQTTPPLEVLRTAERDQSEEEREEEEAEEAENGRREGGGVRWGGVGWRERDGGAHDLQTSSLVAASPRPRTPRPEVPGSRAPGRGSGKFDAVATQPNKWTRGQEVAFIQASKRKRQPHSRRGDEE